MFLSIPGLDIEFAPGGDHHERGACFCISIDAENRNRVPRYALLVSKILRNFLSQDQE